MLSDSAPANVIASAQPAADHHYLTQLTRGFRRLRFGAPLEAEYRRTLEVEQRRSALICAAMTLLIWLGFAISDVVRIDIGGPLPVAPALWFVLVSRWGLLALLAAFCLHPAQWHVPVRHAAFTVYVLVGIVSAVNGIIYKAQGIPSVDTALVVVVMAAFLPLGMTFFRALAAVLLLVLVTAAAGLLLLDSSQMPAHLGLVLVMAIAAAVGAAGGYLREHTHRQQFLLNAILSRQAQFDPLTDLANRRLFQRHAEAAIAHAARHDEPLVLAILDIDHFKSFNDRFGHGAGDLALSKVADVLRDAARRPMDLAARIGGEEFALLLYGCDLAKAESVLETVRSRVVDISLDRLDDARLTISGGATEPETGDVLSDLYDRADRLLYASKTAGRNRISIG